ncbi:unnamed protein product, partial [Nesidiocoris tenuis]
VPRQFIPRAQQCPTPPKTMRAAPRLSPTRAFSNPQHSWCFAWNGRSKRRYNGSQLLLTKAFSELLRKT